jgi:hypothetical protein
VAPLKSEIKVPSSSTKSPKKAFGRKTIAVEIEGETPVKKAPVEVSPPVEFVYRYVMRLFLAMHPPNIIIFHIKLKYFLL